MLRKILVVPDSFKGTMSSIKVCEIIGAAAQKQLPEALVQTIPVADGGEGTVACFLAAVGGTRQVETVQGPVQTPLSAEYAILPDGATAVVEMAAAAGLPILGDRPSPMNSSTYGVGQLFVAAARQGPQHIIVGLGGSATTDGGCGAACAAGVRFLDRAGKEFVPTGGTLAQIAHIDATRLLPAFQHIRFTAMCDVDNPMFGPEGAAHVFAPQKGATPQMVAQLDEGLRHLHEILLQDLGVDVARLPGGGAAGAMGAGMVAFFGAKLQRGIETVLDTVSFDTLVKDADLVITGEGRLDSQSLRGKVIHGVAKRSKKAHVPVLAVVGDIGEDIAPIYDMGVSGVFSINRVALPFAQARQRAEQDLYLTMDNLFRVLKALPSMFG